MKKILLTTIFSVFYIASASAEIGVNIGLSGNAGVFTASANERLAGTGNLDEGSEHGEAGWTSVFIEKTLGPVLLVGIDYVPDGLESETAETAKVDKGPDAITSTIVTNTIKVAFEDLTTYYISKTLGDGGMYGLLGMHTATIASKTTLPNATYGSDDITGVQYGLGYAFDNGLRYEVSFSDFEDIELKDSTNVDTTGVSKITADLDVYMMKVSYHF